MFARWRDRRARETQDDLVPVARLFSEPMAQSLAQLLRNNDVPAMVKSTGAGFALGTPPFGTETVILVHKKDEEQAKQLLEVTEDDPEPEWEEQQ